MTIRHVGYMFCCDRDGCESKLEADTPGVSGPWIEMWREGGQRHFCRAQCAVDWLLALK